MWVCIQIRDTSHWGLPVEMHTHVGKIPCYPPFLHFSDPRLFYGPQSLLEAVRNRPGPGKRSWDVKDGRVSDSDAMDVRCITSTLQQVTTLHF